MAATLACLARVNGLLVVSALHANFRSDVLVTKHLLFPRILLGFALSHLTAVLGWICPLEQLKLLTLLDCHFHFLFLLFLLSEGFVRLRDVLLPEIE